MSWAAEFDHVGVADGADPVGRIVSELIDHFRSVGRPLRFYEVEQKLLDWVGKLRFPAEKLEKEKVLLRERLESVGFEKGTLENKLRKMRHCLELSGIFSRLGWSGEVNVADKSAEEIYDAMLRKLMSGNGEDLTEVVDHLKRKVEELERDSQDAEMLRRKIDALEGEIAELKRKTETVGGENAELKRKGDKDSCEVRELRRKVNELEMENVELKKKGGRDVGEMRLRIVDLEMDNAMLKEKVDGSSCDAVELRTMKEELAMAKAMLKVKAERNSPDSGELSRKVEELEAENKELKMNLEQNVAKGRGRTEDAESQCQILKRELDESERICKGLQREKGILERKNEVVQSNFDELVQENEKLENKISCWKKNYEELQKRVIVLEKDVDELKSCDESVLGPKDGREKHCSDEKFASTSKNGNTCYAENGVGNGKHSEMTGMHLSVENTRDNVVHSAPLPTGDSTPISGRVVDLMDSDDDAALAAHLVEKKQSQNSLDKGPLPTSTGELKRKRDTFIDLTQNEDNIKEEVDLCRSSSWATKNMKRSNQGVQGEKMDRSPRSSCSWSSRSSSTLLT